jgi:peptide/bleomycin uptake transporter
MVQKMLDGGGDISNLFSGMFDFGMWAGIYVIIVVIVNYITQRWLLSWRKSVMWYYHEHWQTLRSLEGSSQRIQEDAKLFTRLLESVGEGAISALMTLLAFSPILWALSFEVPKLLFLNVHGGLMWGALIWALGGTVVLMWLGRKLPHLEYNNQHAEAALRKEYVLGEDDPSKADANAISPLWDAVDHNYRQLFFQFMTFGLGKWTFIQASVLVPLIFISPSIAGGLITWGILMQLLDAFGRVEGSMQYLLRSWTTIVELISVHKRLKEFEKNIN